MLLVNNYQMMGEGRVQIVPCTMIFLPEGNFSEEERQRRAIILQSPQGAILQFDAFDLKQGKVGKLIAGKLIGAVTIRSDQRDPGPQDDLQIITSDVDMRRAALRGRRNRSTSKSVRTTGTGVPCKSTWRRRVRRRASAA